MTAAERAALQPVPPRMQRRHAVAGIVVLIFVLTFVGSWIPAAISRWRDRGAHRRAHLRRVSVAFDWTVRAALQQRLAALASAVSTDTPEGRGHAARTIAQLMLQHLSGARYARVDDRTSALEGGPVWLDRTAMDLRSRFRHETRGRGEGSPVPEVPIDAAEGPGLVVVSLIVGSASEPGAPEPPTSRGAIARVLHELARGGPLDGLEVVWSPSEPGDRMSSYELERIYPELQRLDGDPRLGSARCASCLQLRPGELARCPRCGSGDVIG